MQFPISRVYPADFGRGSTEPQAPLSARQLLSALLQHRRLLAVTTLATGLTGLLYVAMAKPVYVAQGSIQVDTTATSAIASNAGTAQYGLAAPTRTEAEVQILQSRLVLSQVVNDLGLDIHVSPHELPIVGQLFTRLGKDARHSPPSWWPAGYAWSEESASPSRFDIPDAMMGNTFTLRSLGDLHYELLDGNGHSLLQSAVGETASVETAAGPITLTISELHAHAGTTFELSRVPLDRAIQSLKSGIQAEEAAKLSGIVTLKAEGSSPQEASRIASKVLNVYTRQNAERRYLEAKSSLDFLEQQLPEARERVEAAQHALNEYRSDRGSVNAASETSLLLQQASDYERKRLELIGERQEALAQFTPDHPVVQALNSHIHRVERERDEVRRRAKELPQTEQQELRLLSDVDVATRIYTNLLNAMQEMRIAKASSLSNVRIVDMPGLPLKRDRPKTMLVMALSLLGGLCASIFYVAIRRGLSQGVEDPEDIHAALGLATYAAIPHSRAQWGATRLRAKQSASPAPLATANPGDPAVEALQGLRMALQFALMKGKKNVLMLSSPSQGMGKSFVSTNLAAVIALGGKRVALIDGDMRRGELSRQLGISTTPGLSEYLADETVFDIEHATPIAGLTLIPSGSRRQNPSQLLLSERLAQLIERLSKTHDLVIVDTPPALLVADAGIIGRHAGCTLLVVKHGVTTLQAIEQTSLRMRQVGVQIQGIVFNHVDMPHSQYGYYNLKQTA